MEQFNSILHNLESFIKRYHFSALIRGLLLFFGLGLLYAIFWTFIEHLFWLSKMGRFFVFWSLIIVEGLMFYRLVLIPILKYFDVRRGISHEDAAVLVGEFFPEISDKLLNAIQLNKQQKSELLIASIDQKASELRPFAFIKAINLKDNIKYLKYALAPLIILAPFYLFGKQNNIEESIRRVFDYSTEYAPPAPFTFKLMNNDLSTIENTSFVLRVTTLGSIQPEEVQIQVNGQVYYLKKINNGEFEFEFTQPQNDQQFRLISGSVISKDYRLKVVKAPQILTQKLSLKYPPHTQLKQKDIFTFNDLVVPEGTVVSWHIKTASTDSVALFNSNERFYLKKSKDMFSFSMRLFSNFHYTLKTSNAQLKEYEVLESKIQVRPDLPPKINIQAKKIDSIGAPLYFYGQMADDYGVSKLLLHYAPVDQKESQTTIEITNYDKDLLEFFYLFPDSLTLVPDTSYELYFEVFDNDPFPQPNTTRSAPFFYEFKSKNRIEEDRLDLQNQALQDLQKSISPSTIQQNEVDPLQLMQQKNELSFNDRQNIKSILERQEKQDSMMQRFTEQMAKSLVGEPQTNQDNIEKNDLLKRIENHKNRVKSNKKELDELRKLLNELSKEELLSRTEKLIQQNQVNQRSLDQMLALTKRYYVTQKMAQLQQKLSLLSEKQKQQSDKSIDENTKSKQAQINEAFTKLKKELTDLREQNETLAKPIAIPETKKEEQSISDDMENALNRLDEKDSEKDLSTKSRLNKQAQIEQNKAAQKIMQISNQIAQQMSSGSSQRLQEDITMLRQILDNLLLFSFEQENLMMRLNLNQAKHSNYAQNLVYQKNLKTHFEHIDDSLFVLALRQPIISESINKEIEEVYSNIDKSLMLFSENAISRAVGAQQYVITSTNNLADLLSDTLNSMEMQMQMNPGQGAGDMQLPDIIMSQEELLKQTENLMKGQQEGSREGSESSNQPGNQDPNGNPKPDGTNGENNSEGKHNNQEESSQALFELYQKQQALRKALSDMYQAKGQISTTVKSALDSMEKLEQMLLNQGVTLNSLAQMQALKYQYLKLQNAQETQGIEQNRQSQNNTFQFSNQAQPLPAEIKRLFNTNDVLNRESLPLRNHINKRVINYFKRYHD